MPSRNNKRFGKNIISRFKVSLLLLIIFVSTITILPIIQPTNVEAKLSEASMTDDQKIQSLIYYKAIQFCFSQSSTGNVATINLGNNNYFSIGDTVNVGVYMDTVLKDGRAGAIASEKERKMVFCNTSGLMQKAINLWGLSGQEILCNSNYNAHGQKLDSSGTGYDAYSTSPQECSDNSLNWSEFTRVSPAETAFKNYIRAVIYDGHDPYDSVPDKAWYRFYQLSLANSCIPNMASSTYSLTKLTENAYVYNDVSWVSFSTDPPTKIIVNFNGNVDIAKTDNVAAGPVITRDEVDGEHWMTCQEMVDKMNEIAEQWLINTNPDKTFEDPLPGPGVGEKKTSCAIDGIGWIVCPTVNFLAGVSDGAFAFLANRFLQTKPEIFSNTLTKDVWNKMRDFANIAFVIAFLIIIYSQLTSAGISNYGIKKMLPRLIIAAILVNLSYYICQIAVDLSNILGWSINDFLTDIGVQTTVDVTKDIANNGYFGKVATGILASGAAVGAVAALGVMAWTSLATLIPILLAAVVALIMILFILLARQVLIILLIVISPLAFVAYLLPNTEQWFKKWQKAFISLLIVFPTIAIVFGMSNLASSIIGSTGKQATSAIPELISIAVLVLPLFVVPGLLKKAIDGVGNIGGTINALGQKLGGSAGKWTADKFGESTLGRGQTLRKQAKADYKTREFAKTVKAGGWRSRLALGPAIGKMGKYQSDYVQSAADAEVRNAEAKDLSNATMGVQAGFDAATDGKKYLEGIANTGNALQKKAAYHMMGKIGMDDKLRERKSQLANKLATDPKDTQSAQEMTSLQSAISANAGELLKSAPDLVKGAGAWDSVTAEGLAGYSKDTVAEYMKHLTGLHSASINGSAEQQKKYVDAANIFNRAISNIENNSQLVSKFKSGSGLEIINGSTTLNPTELWGLGKIQPTGDIKLKP